MYIYIYTYVTYIYLYTCMYVMQLQGGEDS